MVVKEAEAQLTQKRAGEIKQTLTMDGWAEVVRRFPDLRLTEIRAIIIDLIDPGGVYKDEHEDPDFQWLLRDGTQTTINGLYSLSSNIAERLDRELNPDIV